VAQHDGNRLAHDQGNYVAQHPRNRVAQGLRNSTIGENPLPAADLFGGDCFLSPENAAQYLDVSRKFIYEMIARGELKAMVVGGRLRRIRRSDLELWLTSSNSGLAQRTRKNVTPKKQDGNIRGETA
jgi:excisionase family DNA binding protein